MEEGRAKGKWEGWDRAWDGGRQRERRKGREREERGYSPPPNFINSWRRHCPEVTYRSIDSSEFCRQLCPGPE